MLRQGGQINLAHSLHDLEIIRRWANAIRMNGVDAEMLDEAEIRRLVPILNTSLVCKEIVSGTYHWGFIALIFASSCIYAAVALWVAIRLFQREDVLFRI